VVLLAKNQMFERYLVLRLLRSGAGHHDVVILGGFSDA